MARFCQYRGFLTASVKQRKGAGTLDWAKPCYVDADHINLDTNAAELRERARAARLSMGAYLRRRALGQRVRMAAELRLGAAELRELNRIGVNLNQMARALNSRAVSSPAETQAVVERVGELVAKLLAGERE